jgi:hypothetical protein
MRAPIIIYNLFPRLVGHMGRWPAHAGRAREMGFNWLYLNPVQYPGFSGSLYAVKDFYRLNPLFVPPGAPDDMAELRRTVDAIHHQGLRVMMDLVVNHTAKDSELTLRHPSWFKRDQKGEVLSPSAIDPADARKVTVWGDLAEIDNQTSADREGLWSYWTDMLQFYLSLGFDGFRCDAAYKVPAALWERLIGTARRQRPEVVFAALFSAGLLMPIGYELGFRKQVNVVRTLPEDWEESSLDLSPFIARVNRLKSATPIFAVEGHLKAVARLNGPTTVLSKRAAGLEPALILINKDWDKPQPVDLGPLAAAHLPGGRGRLVRPFQSEEAQALPAGPLVLEPAEIAVCLP